MGSVWALTPARLCSSGRLAELATELGSAPSALPVAALLVADHWMSALAVAAGPATTAMLDAVRGGLGADLSDLHAPQLAALFADLAPVLAREERSVVAAAATDTLGAAGYTVIRESGPAADGVEARRGDEVLLLAVTDGGSISIDHVGTDGACGDRQNDFEHGMAQRGITLTTRAVTAHDDNTGPLFTAARARHEPSLARAVAQHTAPRRSARPVRPGRTRLTAEDRTVLGGSA